ncbi:MAG: prepilin-type N-terminal cleavage/methylation domain-containing protein [Candidatus Pacebacteria bacterium]|nr:prepilin-type N-terminal cleavage/methylation domain-containing protein [Candidatus Paceibacterota bacterium]
MLCNYLALYKRRLSASKPSKQEGFGLVELMVSISIMAIVTAIVFTRQSSFNGSVLLRGEAYKIALQLREIQLNAVSASSDGSGQFRAVLGIHFDTDSSANGAYDIFRDADLDGFFDSGEEFGIQGVLDNRFEIREIRINGTAATVAEASVIFVRPNFDARFFSAPSTEIVGSSIEIDVARRGVTGAGTGVFRTIEITSTGQIAVL